MPASAPASAQDPLAFYSAKVTANPDGSYCKTVNQQVQYLQKHKHHKQRHAKRHGRSKHHHAHTAAEVFVG